MQAETSIPPELDTGPRFRDFLVEDVPQLVALGGQFFAESEFPDFATFSPEHFRVCLIEHFHSPSVDGFVFTLDGEIKGFLFYQLDMSYTEEPIALLWLFYVVPEFRKTPVGRQLLEIAEGHAKAIGATAFYAGAMAGMPSVKNSLRNLYTKAGYEELFWGRKILKETPE